MAPESDLLPVLARRGSKMTIKVIGAGIGRQFINGDPNWCEWRVSYEIDGRGLYYHTVSTRDAHDSQDAIEWAKCELGQPD
jgi:hypothetical protein